MVIRDLGMKFPNPGSKTKRRYLLLECETCYTQFEAQADSVKRRNITECPTCAKNTAVQKRTQHGEVGTRLYNIWLLMRNRCNNPNYNHYSNYGGRGVTVCAEWDNFLIFKTWALANGYSDQLTIDKDIKCKELNIEPPVYSPETCQWVDRKIQMRNRRNSATTQEEANKIIELLDKGLSTAEILKQTKCTRTLLDTIKAGSWR